MVSALIPHIKRLGYGGLLPFVALLAGLLMLSDKHNHHPLLVEIIRYYAALIVTFVGALNWGLALQGGSYSLSQRQSLLTYSVLPSLIAMGLLLLPAEQGLIGFALLYVGCYGIDTRLTLPSMNREYADMRRRLSFSVAGILVLASQLV